METVLQYIIANWPTLAIIIIVGATCIGLSRRFTKWEDKHDRRHEDMERKQDRYDTTVEKILQRIDNLERFLIKNGGADYNEFTKMNSPRQLNEKGWRLYKESGAEKFFSEKKNAMIRILSSEMSKRRVKTALDVDVIASRICYDVSGNEDFKPIKDFIYTHPIFEGSEISIGTISMLMGIELRNLYLSQHPEIDPMSE